MDASLYVTTLTEVLRKVSYQDMENGWTQGFLSHKVFAKEILLLDLVGDDLQDLADSMVGQCGYISLFVTPEIYDELLSILRTSGLVAHIDNLQELEEVDFSDPEKFYFIMFS